MLVSAAVVDSRLRGNDGIKLAGQTLRGKCAYCLLKIEMGIRLFSCAPPSMRQTVPARLAPKSSPR